MKTIIRGVQQEIHLPKYLDFYFRYCPRYCLTNELLNLFIKNLEYKNIFDIEFEIIIIFSTIAIYFYF